jgi:hypothetical protein
MTGNFYVNWTFLMQRFLRRFFFYLTYKTHVKMVFLTMTLKTPFCTTQGRFYVNFNFSESVVTEKTIFKDFSHWNTCLKKCYPYCDPSQPQEAMVLINLILHYVRKLSCKYQLFSGSRQEDFQITSPYFLCLGLYSPWKGTSLLVEQTWIPFMKGWFG